VPRDLWARCQLGQLSSHAVTEDTLLMIIVSGVHTDGQQLCSWCGSRWCGSEHSARMFGGVISGSAWKRCWCWLLARRPSCCNQTASQHLWAFVHYLCWLVSESVSIWKHKQVPVTRLEKSVECWLWLGLQNLCTTDRHFCPSIWRGTDFSHFSSSQFSSA